MKVSVVVPVYNVEPYLKRGLDSLLNQTLQDIEIICVDDKSTDESLLILRDYAAKYRRIKLIELSENQGVAVARNCAMEAATGEYIGFMDPDDYLDLDFYEKLYIAAQSSGADIVVGNLMMTDINTGAESSALNNIKKIKRHKSYFNRNFWSAIYRRDLLQENKIEFPVGIISAQDCVFMTRAVLSTDKVTAIADAYYHYFYQRPDSLDSAALTAAKAGSKYRAFKMSFETISATKLSKSDFAKFVGLHVLTHINYELRKEFENDSDRKKLFDLAVHIYNTRKIPDSVFAKRFNHDAFIAIKRNDYNRLKQNMNSALVYLFGFIPIFRINKHKNHIFINLFDIIPFIKILIKRHRFKVYLFNLIPILNIETY